MSGCQLVHLPQRAPYRNSDLPLILYAAQTDVQGDLAEHFVALFDRRGWPGAWLNGVYPYHHFHARAHEVLGCARGWVEVRLGGPEGQDFRLHTGEALLLPAGTAHCRLAASPDYLIVGSYPKGQSPDLERGDPARWERVLRDVAQVPLPSQDPLFGPDGPAVAAWQTVTSQG